MKKTFVILLASIICIFLATLRVFASSNIDNEKYIPKVITTDNGYKMIFDSELAKIARKMSSDSYGIAIDSNVQEISKTFQAEGFEDIRHSHLFDEPFMGAFSNNFLVGVKTFEVDGVEKHILAIAFRGTQVKDGFDYADLFTDASVLGLNGFHSGFYAAALKAYDTLYDMEFPSLKNEDGSSMTFSDYLAHSGVVGSDYSIFVTGHSLGGAVANIFAGDIISQFGKSNVMCYTFASPIVCSPTKAKEYDAYNIFNIINTNDIVPNVGYNLFAGVRLGTDLKVTVTDSDQSAHSLSVTYEKATNNVINEMDSLYPYIHRTRITTVVNDIESTQDEVHIHTDCSLEKRRFAKYLGSSDLLIYKNTKVNTDILTKGNLTISSGVLEVGEARVEIGGNFNHTYGVLKMSESEGYLLIHGKYDQSGPYYKESDSNLTAGTIEIKGDMINCDKYNASGTHKTILSGELGQKIDFHDVRNTFNYWGCFNILEVSNTSEEGVEFIERANVCGEISSDNLSKIINGQNLQITGSSPIKGQWMGSLTANNWVSNAVCVIGGNLIAENTTKINSNMKVKGNLTISSGVLEVGEARVEIGGNFNHTYGVLKMSESEGYLLIHGKYDQSGPYYKESDSNLTAGTIEIKTNY